jgi:O-antigen/teichoic acid export membrane protein
MPRSRQQNPLPPLPAARPLGQAVLRGSALTGIQVVANKILASVATLLLGQTLSADDFGVAGVAVSLGATLILFQTWVFVDVAIAESSVTDRLLKSAQAGALIFGIAQGLLILIAAPFVQRLYPDKRGLTTLMAIVAIRPVSDALSVAPLAHLRIALSFRAQAWVDGLTAAGGSIASVVLAYLGFGAVAVVLPPIATLAARAAAYWVIAPAFGRSALDWSEVRRVCRIFVRAASGAYLTSVTFLVDAVILGAFVAERSMGLYAFSFNLAIQATLVIAQNVAAAVQPAFAAMGSDVSRQSEGLLRTVRMISVVTVPASLIQSAFAVPVFHALWGTKWDAALPVFMVLSIGQALVFIGSPSIYLLKAQGRFGGYLRLEVVHVVYSIAATLVAVRWGGGVVDSAARVFGFKADPDAAVPIAVSVATAIGWAIFAPLSMWLACRGSHIRNAQIIDVMLRPWIATVPTAGIGAWVAWSVIGRFESWFVTFAVILLLTAVTFVLSVWLGARLHPSTRNDLRSLMARFAPGMSWLGQLRR